jgi:hypothetical protein
VTELLVVVLVSYVSGCVELKVHLLLGLLAVVREVDMSGLIVSCREIGSLTDT